MLHSGSAMPSKSLQASCDFPPPGRHGAVSTGIDHTAASVRSCQDFTVLEPLRVPGAVTVASTRAPAGCQEKTRNSRALPRQGEQGCLTNVGEEWQSRAKQYLQAFTDSCDKHAGTKAARLLWESLSTEIEARCHILQLTWHTRIPPARSFVPPSFSRENSSTHGRGF